MHERPSQHNLYNDQLSRRRCVVVVVVFVVRCSLFVVVGVRCSMSSSSSSLFFLSSSSVVVLWVSHTINLTPSALLALVLLPAAWRVAVIFCFCCGSCDLQRHFNGSDDWWLHRLLYGDLVVDTLFRQCSAARVHTVIGHCTTQCDGCSPRRTNSGGLKQRSVTHFELLVHNFAAIL